VLFPWQQCARGRGGAGATDVRSRNRDPCSDRRSRGADPARPYRPRAAAHRGLAAGFMTTVRPAPAVTRPPLDVAKLRADFPALQLTVRGKPLVYLDNAATSQKPRAVLDALRHYYEEGNANVHRGVHY